MNFLPKILAFAGSTRAGSFNKKLIRIAATSAQALGAGVRLIDLAAYPLPLYDGDLEEREGIPENAQKLKQLFWEHHGFLISSPEYNSSISGVLKNTIDWVSRPVQGYESLVWFKDKWVGLMSASPGALGGLRGLVTVRSILLNIGCYVLPHQMAISKADEAFDEKGRLKDPRQSAGVEKIAATLVEMIRKTQGSFS